MYNQDSISLSESTYETLDKTLDEFLVIRSRNVENTWFICSLCKQEIGDDEYRYKCLICQSFNLCSDCFDNRRVRTPHEISHPVLRICDRKIIFGKEYDEESIENMNLEKLSVDFKDEIHKSITCISCDTNLEIVGIRFKCEYLRDYNLCFKCFQDMQASQTNSDHVMIAIGKTFSIDIDPGQVEKLENQVLSYTELQNHHEKVFLGVLKKEKENKVVQIKHLIYNRSMASQANNREIFNKLRESYNRQLLAFNEIKGENIARIIGKYSEENKNMSNYYLVSEFMEKGNLSGLLISEPEMDYRRRLDLAIGIASGLARIHDLGFIHRGIQPKNIYVTSNYVAKIGDMGLAKVFDELQPKSLTVMLPGPYMPPEAITRRYTKKLDIYSFGFILVELFNGSHEFKKLSTITLMPRIFESLIKACVNIQKPDNRPDSQVIQRVLLFCSNFVDYYIRSLNMANFHSLSVDQKNYYFEKMYKFLLKKCENNDLELSSIISPGGIFSSRNGDDKTQPYWFVCNICKRKVSNNYRYKCAICKDFDICSYCFEDRKASYHHKSDHPLIRISDHDSIFDEFFKLIELTDLEILEKKFCNEEHTNFNCSLCQMKPAKPIRGVRFSCEICRDFNYCSKCFHQKRFHRCGHSVVVFLKDILKSPDLCTDLIEEIKSFDSSETILKEINFKTKTFLCSVKKFYQNDATKKSEINEHKRIHDKTINAYSKIKGENIFRLFTHSKISEENVLYFIQLFEFTEKGTLSNLLEKESDMIYKRRLDIAIGLVTGLVRIHELGFIHGNLRSSSTFVTSDYVPKIGDLVSSIYSNDRDLLEKDAHDLCLTLVEIFGGKLLYNSNEFKIESTPKVFWEIIEQFMQKCSSCSKIKKTLEFFQNVEQKLIKNKLSSSSFDSYTNDQKNEIFECVYQVVINKLMERFKKIDLDRLSDLRGLTAAIADELTKLSNSTENLKRASSESSISSNKCKIS